MGGCYKVIEIGVLLNNMCYTMTKNINFGRYSQNLYQNQSSKASAAVAKTHYPKTKVTMTHLYDASQFQCLSPACKSSQASISIGYPGFVDMHQCFLVYWDDVNIRRDDIDRNFIVHVWRAVDALTIVLKHPKSKKICLNVSNAHLKMG